MHCRAHASGRPLRGLAWVLALGLTGLALGSRAQAQAGVIAAIVHDEDDAAVYSALEAMISRPLVRFAAEQELDAAALDAAGLALGATLVLDVREGSLRLLRVGVAPLYERSLSAEGASSAYTRALALAELLELDQARATAPALGRGAATVPPDASPAPLLTPPPEQPPATDAEQAPSSLHVVPSVALGASLSLPLDGEPWLVQPALALGLTLAPRGEAFFFDALIAAAGLGRFERPAGDQQVEYTRADFLAGVGFGGRMGILALSLRALGGLAFRRGEASPAAPGRSQAVAALVPELGASASVRAYLVSGLFVGLSVGTLWILEPTTYTLRGMRALREGAPHLLIDAQVGWAFE